MTPDEARRLADFVKACIGTSLLPYQIDFIQREARRYYGWQSLVAPPDPWAEFRRKFKEN